MRAVTIVTARIRNFERWFESVYRVYRVYCVYRVA